MNSRRLRMSARRPLPAFAQAPAPAGDSPYARVGAQSFSFRTFDLTGAIACLSGLGSNRMECCAVHFPLDAGAPEFQEAKRQLDAAGVKVVAFGVEHYTADEDASRTRFEAAAGLGVEVLTADLAPESFDHVEALCEQHKLAVAIHNHGPGARYDKVADTLAAVEGRSPLVGACVDTGHCIRSGEAPHEVLEQLGSRVLSLHLKDWKAGGDETILGDGDLDLDAVARALGKIAFSGPIVMEYELDPENPVPGMVTGWNRWRTAVERVQAR